MPSLRLFLFGSPHAELDGRVIHFERRKTLALLAYLAITGLRQQRDTLAAIFWSDFPSARSRSNLRREIFTLNATIGNQWLESDRNAVEINHAADLWIDVQEFQRKFVPDQHNNDFAKLGELKEAVNFYGGDFLVGFSLPSCPEFEEWQFFQREHLRSLYTTALEKLAMAPFPEVEIEIALGYALQWEMADPLNEAAYQLAVRLYLQADQISAAKNQYERCLHMLQEELHIQPSDETIALYQQITHRS